MEYRKLGGTDLLISRIGIGGHYKEMEIGQYDDRTAHVEKYLQERCVIIQEALDLGINYFDSTWKNEAELLGKTLKELGARNKAIVNGMVLGVFTGSAAQNITPAEYFDRNLDARLAMMPDHRFDTFMINAIEEGFDRTKLDRLLPVCLHRMERGDFKTIGFSCHNHALAREIADQYDVFDSIMLAYNYWNRTLNTTFDGYRGKASIIAMKPLVWAEYGIPFCSVNNLPDFQSRFGFVPDQAVVSDAIRFILSTPNITATVCAVNSMHELEGVASAVAENCRMDVLDRYRALQMADGGIPLFASSLLEENPRSNYCALRSLCRVLDVPLPSRLVDDCSKGALLEIAGLVLKGVTCGPNEGMLKSILAAFMERSKPDAGHTAS